jgi:NADPH-dependent 2,4-dienoyl-CoA reductase/sulfur reductase-like enzyme
VLGRSNGCRHRHLLTALSAADGSGTPSPKSSRRICVIGGGAAGFMAAIEAGRGVQGMEGVEVVLVEGTKKVRGAIMRCGGTGGGIDD